MQELGLMERFADPALFGTLSQGEKAVGGLITTLMGMGTTFVILILLWGVIALTSKIIKGFEGRTAAVEAAEKAAPAAVTSAPTAAIGVIPAAETSASQSHTDGSDGQLIAVLMAAIAANSGGEAISNLRIRKIERISGYRPAWNSAGSADCIESRKF